ncbi:hypothetical protein [Chelativorans sp. M5D2P16]|uniref:hypothetical protein n=1 Tax=Chelativorans sp. M5D2P16 TaxID=3095678 RepID=UPI002ACABF32|nr:hypothetical protein [Chelativorans sp. M5D2P16]MDZ5696457.1 hypothetical protein [Chelativorans sp. M5D2P16]
MRQSTSPAAANGRTRPLRLAFLGALFWSAAAGASALLGLSHWADLARAAAVSERFALGALIAFPAALFFARPAARGGGRIRRFFTFLLLLGSATLGATGFVFALQSVLDAASWHGHPVHLVGIWLFYTVLVGLYEFAVIGVRLYFPYGLAALLAFSLWFALRPR